MPLFTQFSGKSKTRQINLSGRTSSQPSNSEALLNKAREERRARERTRLEITSVGTIQRVWRGRRVARRVRAELITEVDDRFDRTELDTEDWLFVGRALLVTHWSRFGNNLDGTEERLLVRWCEQTIEPTQGECSDHTFKALRSIL
jgi:hypothetical protein